MKIKSIEERVEDWAKGELDKYKIDHFGKTEKINEEIRAALVTAPSKSGGGGGNYPDIQVFIEPRKGRYIPVMIEVKGKKGDLAKFNHDGTLTNKTDKGEVDFAAISRFALNGAVHYAQAIVRGTKTYKEAIAIGVNGWGNTDGSLNTELAVYYISRDSFFLPKKIADYTDLSFLRKKSLSELIEAIGALSMTKEEREKMTRNVEMWIESRLQTLNQKMRDELQISENMRVTLVAGMIMAGLGVEGKVSPLDTTDLKGDMGTTSHDGAVIINRIASFLQEKDLPQEKRDMIRDVLSTVFLATESLRKPVNGESPLKTVYSFVLNEIMPYFSSKHHLDFTGRLFNVLNAWVKVPDGAENDVVLTPRYVTDFMARLAKVNKDSFVWDYAVGSAGFLISSMRLMVEDATASITSPAKRDHKINSIKLEQLLGIEKLADVYLLAVLNMILMGDGSANIIHANSLTEYDGKYGQGKRRGDDFPADVFLLNPPYSAPGKGFVFVEKALSRMKHGRAAVLIQENAGSGNGLPYTANILKHSSLLASIHMADIFKGKVSVRTAVYVFEVGVPHDPKQLVRFIDFDDDGYIRQNRKKSSLAVNLRDSGKAHALYDEVVNLVLYGKSYLKLLPSEAFIEDTISLNGDDWTQAQHRKIENQASLEDFEKVVTEYLAWKVGKILKEEGDSTGFSIDFFDTALTRAEKTAVADYKRGCFDEHSIKAERLFKVEGNPQLNKEFFCFSSKGAYPYFTRTVMNNGILGYVDYLDDKHKIKGNSLAIGMIGMQFFYMAHDFYAGQFTKTAFPNFSGFNESVALYFIARFLPHQKYLQSGLVRDFKRLFNSIDVGVPLDSNGNVDSNRIGAFIGGLIKKSINRLMSRKCHELPKKTVNVDDNLTVICDTVPAEEGLLKLAADENGE